jgi:hypothetical protein
MGRPYASALTERSRRANNADLPRPRCGQSGKHGHLDIISFALAGVTCLFSAFS